MQMETVRLSSSALGKETRVAVFVPDRGEGPFASLYLFHGTDGSCASFPMKSGLDELIDHHQLVAVMPDLENSWCCNDPRSGGRAWQDYLSRELVDYVDVRFRTDRESSRRGVAGFSMGGYGALLLALKHADVFSVGCSLSGSLSFGHESRVDRPEREQFMQAVAPPGGENDLWRLAEQVAERSKLPALWLEVGREDHLLKTNRRYRKHLELLSIPHHYAEPPGGHDWTFVDQRLPALLDFAAAHLT